MRQWRVGTISLGVIFLGCGAALLSWLLSGTAMPDLYLRWWPVILLVLGLEILASTWQRFEGPARFTYDGVSILLIFVILVGSFGLSLLNGLGLTTRIVSEFSGNLRRHILAPQDVSVPDEVKRIVVTSQQGKLRVLTTAASTCTIQGDLSGFGSDDLWTKAISQVQLVTRIVGDTLWVELPNAAQGASLGNRIRDVRYELVLPRHLPVEIDCQQYVQLDLRPSQLQKDWIIKGNAAVDITATAEDHLRVKSISQDPEEMQGNVKWQVADGGITTLFGSGKTTINVLSRGSVSVYAQ